MAWVECKSEIEGAGGMVIYCEETMFGQVTEDYKLRKRLVED